MCTKVKIALHLRLVLKVWKVSVQLSNKLECDNKSFERIVEVVSELKSVNMHMIMKNHFTLFSCFVCIQVVQKASIKVKNSHKFSSWRTRMLVSFPNKC